MNKISIDEMLDKLEEAAELEDTELGEQWRSLVGCEAAAKYGSDEFRTVWEKEVKEQYEYLISNFRIVERTEIRKVTHKTKALEFVG